ncbi:hypothetical protein DPMN_020495 [Dreissena polymorpha]|uniref:Uncharacterized protein n=1 Tax=Dreissena polymorpha TaxID=45954 RepID=A0A9D4NM88_DREPO|nr:hypothetical protein DPMN_020495 [Dreissena polymorpha]
MVVGDRTRYRVVIKASSYSKAVLNFPSNVCVKVASEMLAELPGMPETKVSG